MVWWVWSGDASTVKYSVDWNRGIINPDTGQKIGSDDERRFFLDPLRACEPYPYRRFFDAPFPHDNCETKHDKLPQVWNLFNSFCGQQTFADLVEEFEPGVHELIPLTFRDTRTGREFPEQFFLLNIQNLLESVVVDHPGVAVRQIGERKAWSEVGSKVPMVFHENNVAGHHIWRDCNSPMRIFMSDEFADALEKCILKGWRKARHYETV